MTLDEMNERLKEVGAILLCLRQTQNSERLLPEAQRSILSSGEWTCQVMRRRRKLEKDVAQWPIWGYGFTPQAAFDNAIEKFLSPPKPKPTEKRVLTKLDLGDLGL